MSTPGDTWFLLIARQFSPRVYVEYNTPYGGTPENSLKP